MSAEGRAPKSGLNRDAKDALSEILDFGPPELSSSNAEQGTSPRDLENRLRRLNEQLRDLNARLERLRHLF